MTEPNDDPHAIICKTLCQSKVFETGQGTCALVCMDQLGEPRKRGCYHASRVHDRVAVSILEALTPRADLAATIRDYVQKTSRIESIWADVRIRHNMHKDYPELARAIDLMVGAPR